jgi:hypothetical protein
MQLSKSAKIVIGTFTFLPFMLLLGSFAFLAYQIISMLFAEKPMMPLLLLSYLGYVIPYLFAFFILYVGLGIFYLVHILQNHSIDTEKRILWIVVLITLNGISMPIYWYVHLWKKKSESNTSRTLEQAYEPRT